MQQAPQESEEKGLLCLVRTAFPGPGIMLVLKYLFNKALDYCRPVLPLVNCGFEHLKCG